MIELIVCDYSERAGDDRQPIGPVIMPFIAEPDDSPGQAYADFRALYNTWQQGEGDIVGFFGYRKYIYFDKLFAGITYEGHSERWLDCDEESFYAYREELAKWDGAEILPLLATHDIIVTPPFDVSRNGGIMADFAGSRSPKDASALTKALGNRGVYTISNKIYPYIFITRWSVFDRFMKFAWPLAQELEPLCKGNDSTNETYKKRPMAYVLERAFSLWLEGSGLSSIELPIVNCWEI